MLDELLKNPDILKIIAAPLVGLVPVLINLLINWLDKRSHTSRRNAELIYVNQRVSFLKTWYEAQEKIGDPTLIPEIKSKLEDELRDVYNDFSYALVEADKLTNQRKELTERFKNTNAFRRFFLFYTPYNVSGWLYHTLYYMSLFPWLALIGIVTYQTTVQHLQIDLTYLYIGIGLTVLVIFFRFLGRRVALPIEETLATVDRKSIRREKPAA